MPGSGYLEATLGAGAPWGGPAALQARAEVGVRPTEAWSVFGFAEATLRDWQAGLGARLTW